ncbi:MAG TPA: peptidylprolyl isomerase [Magnetovibrio sp.]
MKHLPKNRHFAILMYWLSALAFLCSTPIDARAQQDGLGIAAIVNEDVVSALDLHLRTTMIIQSSSMADTPETRSRLMPQVLRGLIDEKLMMQEVHRANITVAQEDINDSLKRIADDNKVTVAQLEEQINQMGVPLTALTSRLEAEIGWQVFVANTLSRSIKIGDEEINDEIKRIKASAGQPEYLLAEIFLPVENPAQDKEVQDIALRLLQQMKEGAPFKALAINFSRANTAALGGDMGWVQASHLDPQLLSVVGTLQPGNVTLPIRALGGYYLLLLRDIRTSPGLASGGDTLLKLSQLHLQATPQDDLNAVAGKLVTMSQGMTSCAQLEALGKQSGSPMSGSLGEVALSALPDDMRAALTNLPVGKPSAPVGTGGGVAVMMVCERQDPDVDMDQIRANISKRLLLERLDVVAERHLRDLRRSAFVEIRL